MTFDHYLAFTGWVTAKDFASYARPRMLRNPAVIPRTLPIQHKPRVKVKDLNKVKLKQLRNDFNRRITQRNNHEATIRAFFSRRRFN